MIDLDRYRLMIQFRGLEGLSEIGFKTRGALLEDLFPTADELVLAMKACFYKLDQAASIIYEVPDRRFEVVESNRVLEMAVPDARGDFVAVIIDVLALDVHNAQLMLNDIETTCGFVRAKVRDAIGIMEMSENDYVQRLKDSMNLMANELRPRDKE